MDIILSFNIIGFFTVSLGVLNYSQRKSICEGTDFRASLPRTCTTAKFLTSAQPSSVCRAFTNAMLPAVAFRPPAKIVRNYYFILL